MNNFGGVRSDLFNSGGMWPKFRGELAKRGSYKIQGGGGGVGLWMKLCATLEREHLLGYFHPI